MLDRFPPPFKMADFSAKCLPEQLRRSQFWSAGPGAPGSNLFIPILNMFGACEFILLSRVYLKIGLRMACWHLRKRGHGRGRGTLR